MIEILLEIKKKMKRKDETLKLFEETFIGPSINTPLEVSQPRVALERSYQANRGEEGPLYPKRSN